MKSKDAFLKKAKNKQLVICVIGLGYVGLPLAEAYTRQGIKVIGYDINPVRIEQMKAGKSGMLHIADERVAKMVDSGLFEPSADENVLASADALLICVPTPLDEHHNPDLSYVISTCHKLKSHLRPGQIVVLESTTYPGTTEQIMTPILEESGLVAGEDFAMAYSPEREDPGNAHYETSTIPKLVGADSEAEREMADATYRDIVKTVLVPNTRVAEAAKLTENIFRWVNIGLVNELKMVFDKMDIDVWEVIKAADSKPFGFMAFYPGPGVGGHCIRIDPYYLTWKAREHGVSTRFIELAGEVNIQMPRHVVSRLMEELNIRQKRALAGSRILLCGMAYKANIDDMRESPSMELMDLLKKNGAHVDYLDSYVPEIPPNHEYPQYAGLKSISWDEKVIENYDAALVATDHCDVDYEKLASLVPLVVDTRNISKNVSKELLSKIAKV